MVGLDWAVLSGGNTFLYVFCVVGGMGLGLAGMIVGFVFKDCDKIT